MSLGHDAGRLPAAYLSAGSSSFTDFIGAHAPHLLPSRRPLPAGGSARGAARHDDRLGHLRRRRGDGRRPPGHDGQHHRQPRHGEGLRGRRVLRRRDRRHRRHRDRAGQALPGRARALREDRGRAAVAGGQGEPAGLDDPGQPGHGHAGPVRRAALRRVRPRPQRGPDLLLRRHRRLLRGARPPQRRLRLAVRARGAEEDVAPGPARRTGRQRGRRGDLRRRGRRLRDRWPGRRPPHLAQSSPSSTMPVCASSRTTSSGGGRAGHRRADRGNPGGAR